MTKKHLAIAFLITGFLVGDAYGESEVYCCSENLSYTFHSGKESSKPSDKKLSRFKIKLDRPLKKEIRRLKQESPQEEKAGWSIHRLINLELAPEGT